ncbi:dipeptide/oligopeptide/nickel ABC transporter permease/ATP-binding protein [Nonomuraea harbinensis]|uniref:Dipeptide/oligopeptide/nickel ABC transporter permease/ATP-binding protein n=1 Tax=Nonomuraea harbinensis TaxID=1286938 RepID=A0ABW1BMZ0_9ACTN|nr:dipeptide/oligopeptide/nickel ABC transporter permease/ATP-binding protein [Nonomuraea harbinensis]
MTAGTRLRRLLAQKATPVAGLFLAAVVLTALLAPLLAPYPPDTGDLLRPSELPSAGHWLGTDSLGRDVLSRLMYGARAALLAALVAVVIAVLIGLPLGLVLGYLGGWPDRIAMRVAEAVNAMPFLLVAITLIAILGPGLIKSMAAVGVIYAVMVLRLVRGEVLAAREELYVTGALVVGNRTGRLLWRHVLPNVAPSLIVQITAMFATGIIVEATLSYLGLGTQPPDASWGNMLADAQASAYDHPFLALPAGFAIMLTVLAFNLFGDGVRDLFAREATGSVLHAAPARRVTQVTERAGGPEPAGEEPLLRVRDLSVSFPTGPGERADVVSGVSFDLGRRRMLGLVGESGSGKSVTAMALLGLVPDPGRVTAATITFDGRELAGASGRELRRIRGREVGVVFQDPLKALNPAFTIGTQLTEPLRVLGGMSAREARARAVELLDLVRIHRAAERLGHYPHQFSGGMAQRVMIAMALSMTPKLLIADEPTTALDVTVQGEVLDLLRDLQAEIGMSVLVITHDQGVVADLADDLMVMYAGELVETGSVRRVFERPRHPYTAGLLASMPRNRPRAGRLPAIPGTVPHPGEAGPGCRFAARCPFVIDRCREAPVELTALGDGAARCLRVAEQLTFDGTEAWTAR